MNTEVMFSSKTDQWATPEDFFTELNKEFNFTLDPCADEYNHKCAKYFTASQNGLVQNWGGTESFAIRHMEGISAYGLRSLLKKDTRKTPLFVC